MSVGTQYTRERMAEAAQRCANIDEVIAFFGTRPYRSLRRHLFKRFAHFGIDVSHFPRRVRLANEARPPRDEFRKAIVGSVSIADALRRLGRPDNSRTRALFHEWIADDGIDTSHFLGQAHGRGKPGRKPRKSPEEVLVKHGTKRRTRTAMLRRALREIGVPGRCAECGTAPEWCGRPMTLEIDHINGDWSDDRPEDLRLLCPNCHATTGTWCRGGRPRATTGRRSAPTTADRSGRATR